MVDNAGIYTTRKGKKGEVQAMVQEQVENVIRFSHVTLLLIDSMEAFTKTDLMILNKVLQEGRAVVVCANKWDLVEDKWKKRAVKWMEKQLEKGLGLAKGVPLAFISAKTG